MVERMLCMYEVPGSIPGISMGYFGVIMSVNAFSTKQHENGWHENASAGNRTRVNCLEGSYAHHYTTDATCLLKKPYLYSFYFLFFFNQLDS